MTVKFEFKKDDEYVLGRLTEQEIGDVWRWQDEKYSYNFSFHLQHVSGWPCYLIEEEGPYRHLPKINLKDPEDPLRILQSDSIRNSKVGEDFKGVIESNLEVFQKLAERYYVGVDKPPAMPGIVVQFDCTTSNPANKPRTVSVRLPAAAQIVGESYWDNFKRFAQKPRCAQHRTPECLEGKGVEITATQYAAVRKYYDENGEMHED